MEEENEPEEDQLYEPLVFSVLTLEHPSSLSCLLPVPYPVLPETHWHTSPSKPGAGNSSPNSAPLQSGTGNVTHSHDLGSSSWHLTQILSLPAWRRLYSG